MSAPPYMPFFVGDYLADTTHLTCTEHGAYMLLLMSLWRNGGSLPNDDKTLARHARCTKGQWDRMRPVLIDFFEVSDREIVSPRLRSELTKHADAVEQRRERSSNGGKAKSLKYKKATPAPSTAETCQPEPEPYTSETNVSSVSHRAKAPPKPDGFEVFWQAYPRHVGKDAARKAFPKAIARIEAEDPLAVILAGIERAMPGWDDPQFIPHPATWLNQGRWDDDAPATRRTEARHAPSRQDRPSKSDHLAAIFDAMGAASGRTQQPGGGDRPPPRDEGRVRALPPAA